MFRFQNVSPRFLHFTVVNQYYEAQVYDVFVIRGNTALFKCQIPSFVADHVEIVEWTATDGTSFKKDELFGNETTPNFSQLHFWTSLVKKLLESSSISFSFFAFQTFEIVYSTAFFG